jgi:hypothetical protein
VARIRSVKPEFWTDPDNARLSRDARLLYIALWNISDEHGRLHGDPRFIKGQAFPYDDDMSADAVLRLLVELSERGVVVRYEVEGNQYLFLPTLAKHQRLEAEKVPSRHPAPTDPSAAQIGADESALLYVAGSREQGAGDTAAQARPSEPDRFDEFYAIYPRKVKPDAARKAWKSALKRATAEQIIEGARRLVADPNLPEKQFIPHPSSWLNAGSWDDEPLPPRTTQGQPPPFRPTVVAAKCPEHPRMTQPCATCAAERAAGLRKDPA